MDREDQEHFKTIANQSARPQTGLSRPLSKESLQSRLDQASCLLRAKTIFGCYRRDEAHDPEMFVAALAAILGDYPAIVVDYIADPRTGVLSEFPMGLPNVGQIRELCETITRRMETIAKPIAVAAPYVPPPMAKGKISYGEFLKLAQEKKTASRPIGAFESGGYLG